jgi:hypothetical protein
VTRARADPLNVLSKNGTLELRRNFFTIRVVKDWNTVPNDIKNILVPGQFKRALARWQAGARAEQLNGSNQRQQSRRFFFKRTNWPMKNHLSSTRIVHESKF